MNPKSLQAQATISWLCLAWQIDQHPGGGARIMLAAGGAIDPFWAMYAQHQTAEVRKILEGYRIGSLVSFLACVGHKSCMLRVFHDHCILVLLLAKDICMVIVAKELCLCALC